MPYGTFAAYARTGSRFRRPAPPKPIPAPNGAPLLRSARYHHDDLGNLTDTWINGVRGEVHEPDPLRPHRLVGTHFVHGSGLRDGVHGARGRCRPGRGAQ